MLKIGSHVSFKSPNYLVDSVKESIANGANTMMIYLGPPQNSNRVSIDKYQLDEYFAKYQDIIPILQLKKGFIDEDDCMALYFNIKDDPTSKKKILNLYIEFSNSGNMRITDIDFDR